MLKIVGLTVMLAFSCVTAGLAQKTEPPGTQPTQSANKGASPQGGGAQGASGAVDKNVLANKLAGAESQTTPGASIVKCAIKLEPGDESALAAKWLDSATGCRDSSEDNSDKNPTAGLNDRLFLLVSLGGSQLRATDKAPVNLDEWRLSINGIVIDDAKLSWEAGDDKATVLSTKLKRTDTSKAAWNELFSQKLREHTVPVTITDASKKPLPSEAYFNLRVMQLRWYSWILLGLLLVLVIVLLSHDRLREMLREDGPYKNPGGGTKAAYSLSRVQMFYWFSITILCYVVIWIITGDRDTVNNDVLTLMGISAGTFLGAVSIDSSKKSQAQSDLPDATAKLQQTQATAAAIAAVAGVAQPAALVASQAVAVQQRAVAELNDRTLASRNENFLTDILSDEDGLSFHRFQIFAWSLVLGIIFIASVVQTLGMPTFGNTLLGLMGISSGTYLGLKFPEQKTK